jgi:vacuolar-type H+-ATPase subunit F/Vma7
VSEIAVIGAAEHIAGFALAGARIYPAFNNDQARAAWQHLPPSVAIVIMSTAAADATEGLRVGAPGPMIVRLPL